MADFDPAANVLFLVEGPFARIVFLLLGHGLFVFAVQRCVPVSLLQPPRKWNRTLANLKQVCQTFSPSFMFREQMCKRKKETGLTLYSRILRAVTLLSFSRNLSCFSSPPSCAGRFTPITSSSSLFLFCSGVSVHKAIPSPSPPRGGGALEPFPVLNFRLRNFVGSTRDDQSSEVGGTSIHSSRWGFWAAAEAAFSSSRRVCCRSVSASEG